MRAWRLRKDDGTKQPAAYRLSILENGTTRCTCKGYAEHRHCKHDDWLRAWGIPITSAEATYVVCMETRLEYLEGGCEDLTNERQELTAKLAKVRRRWESAQEEANRLRKCLGEALRSLKAEQARSLELGKCIEAAIRSDEAVSALAVEATNAAMAEREVGEEPSPAQPEESEPANWERKNALPLAVAVRSINEAAGTARIELPNGHLRTVKLSLNRSPACVDATPF